MDVDLPAPIAPLGFLLGTWSGTGRGEYPTIEDFAYREEVTFACPGKPFLVYAQRTWDARDGQPLHVETGYWRMGEPGRVEVMIAHPFGVTELLEGTLDEQALDLRSTHLGLAGGAKRVEETRRRITVRDGELRYRVAMAAVGQPLRHHLAARLRPGPAAAG